MFHTLAGHLNDAGMVPSCASLRLSAAGYGFLARTILVRRSPVCVMPGDENRILLLARFERKVLCRFPAPWLIGARLLGCSLLLTAFQHGRSASFSLHAPISPNQTSAGVCTRSADEAQPTPNRRRLDIGAPALSPDY